jgi:hypothetical protein
MVEIKGEDYWFCPIFDLAIGKDLEDALIRQIHGINFVRIGDKA